jgi:hypothetical protein
VLARFIKHKVEDDVSEWGMAGLLRVDRGRFNGSLRRSVIAGAIRRLRRLIEIVFLGHWEFDAVVDFSQRQAALDRRSEGPYR